jgi:hypothetical protein
MREDTACDALGFKLTLIVGQPFDWGQIMVNLGHHLANLTDTHPLAS